MEPTWEDVWAFADKWVLPIAIRILLGLAVFYFGRMLARLVLKGVQRMMDRTDMDVSMRKFLSDVIYTVLVVAVVIAAMDTAGVKTTAVVAVLGAAGLAVGLALQGSLSNFAAGVMIIVLRPYRVGDSVVIGKYVGRVEVIKVFNTVLVTPDHREVIIPNAKIISDSIENTTVRGTRRIDIVVSVPHGTNLHEAREWLAAAATSDQRVEPTPAPAVELSEVSADGMKLTVRPWARVDDYSAVANATIERITRTLDERGVKFTAALQ